MPESLFVVIMTTLPDQDQANNIAKILVEERLAACVQVLPAMTSTYIWEGNLCQESEHLVLIKTLESNYAAIMTRLKSLHPYEVPEAIAIPIKAIAPNYAAWITAMCG
ncbi:MAG: divalent-cation tolerance protein CutA [Pseudanabaena sp.]|nr:MAG: divalent-cation tolerance protein CutA [Pseudanabaena sp.]